MSNIWIKNPHVSNAINYQGQDILPGEYQLISTSKLVKWQNDSSLLSDIGSAIAIVAKDDSGNNDILDINDAIEYLKQNQPKKVQNIAIADPHGKRARLVGTHSGIAPADASTSLDWKIPQLQFPAGVDVNSIFNGVQYYAENSNMGDTLTFQVVDKDGSGVALGIYPQAYYDAYKDGQGVLLVEQFGDPWYIGPNSLEDIILYKASLLPGLYIRVIYTNTHAAQTVNWFVNLFRHIEA
jgi:hypothetical protein